MPGTFEKNAGGIPGLIVITQQHFADRRGFFTEITKQSEYDAQGIPRLVQINGPHTYKGGFRGLHYQAPDKEQGKLISVLNGTIFDVAVDIRKGSPTFGQWFGTRLSRENGQQLWIPAGFAHGFVSLTDSDVLYGMAHNEYAPAADNGIIWNDSEIGIDWPIEPSIFSDKDQLLPRLRDIDSPFTFEA